MKFLKQIQERFINFVEELTVSQKRLIWYLSDAFIFILASFAGHVFFYKMILLPKGYYIVSTLLALLFYFFLSGLAHLNARIKRYVSLGDILRLFSITTIASLASSLITSLFYQVRSMRYIVLVAFLTGVGVVTLRLIWQTMYRNRFNYQDIDSESKETIVLIGAGDGGSLFMNSYRRHPSQQQIVAVIDENPAKWNTNLNGVKVVGGMDKLASLKNRYQIDKAVIAIPSLNPQEYEKIIQICNDLSIPVYKMPKVEEVLLGIHQKGEPMRKIEITDLLGRQEVDLDETRLREEIQGKTILITGAGGSIGSEIARQVSKLNPERIILLGHGENSIYHIYHELLNKGNELVHYEAVIADVQDYHRLVEIFNDYQPDIVYHAAAHKHVPLMEANPQEAFKNNVIGTYNVAKAVDTTKVKKMVMISTDKAVRPPNVMGATKRIAELIVTGFGRQSQDSTYCAVRFGNVLGSRGSVIPAFERMIAEGGPVRVTDFRMIRYFMTIPEASRLVIHAGAYADNGEVFILDMGQPVKILDLAKKMILLSGYDEAEIGIVESGIRPGEKLYEELITSPENISRQIDDKVFVSKVESVPLSDIEALIEDLSQIQDDPKELKKSIIKFANESAQAH